VRLGARQVTAAPVDLDGGDRLIGAGRDAEAIEHAEHRLRVVGEKRSTQDTVSLGQRGTHQSTIGDALRPRQDDIDVGRRNQRLDRQRIRECARIDHASSERDDGR